MVRYYFYLKYTGLNMRINEISTICIRTSAEQFDSFEEQSGIKEIPKRKSFMMISENQFSSFNEPRILPELRNNKDKNIRQEIARWATHTAILSTFLKTEKAEWLFLIEDTVELNDYDIPNIENKVKAGINILSESAKAYIIDRPTVKTLLQNAQIYYTPIDLYIDDLTTLGLIQKHHIFNLKQLVVSYIHMYIPIISIIVFILICFCFYFYQIVSNKLFRKLPIGIFATGQYQN